MTVTTGGAVISDRFDQVTVGETFWSLACKADLGVWAERKRHFTNAPFHWEWYDAIQTENRLCIVAPREHAKSEAVTINQVAWRSIYNPAHWSFVFAETRDQSYELLERIKVAVAEVEPWMTDHTIIENKRDVTFANWSRVTVGSAAKSVRGAHPDLIVGDDVLSDRNTMSHLQRKRIEKWWLGTISPMAHPGTWRTVGLTGQRVWMPPTRIHLVGTPFHAADLLFTLKTNPLWAWRRYAAEYEELLPGSYAVEAA